MNRARSKCERSMQLREKTYGIVSLNEWIVHSNNLNVWVLDAKTRGLGTTLPIPMPLVWTLIGITHALRKT